MTKEITPDGKIVEVGVKAPNPSDVVDSSQRMMDATSAGSALGAGVVGNVTEAVSGATAEVKTAETFDTAEIAKSINENQLEDINWERKPEAVVLPESVEYETIPLPKSLDQASGTSVVGATGGTLGGAALGVGGAFGLAEGLAALAHTEFLGRTISGVILSASGTIGWAPVLIGCGVAGAYLGFKYLPKLFRKIKGWWKGKKK